MQYFQCHHGKCESELVAYWSDERKKEVICAKAQLLSVPLATLIFREQIRAIRQQFWLGHYKKGSELTMYIEGREDKARQGKAKERKQLPTVALCHTVLFHVVTDNNEKKRI